jgi:4-hydroxybenzoate polyprenyltransferase
MATQAELARYRSLLISLGRYFFPRIRRFVWIAFGLLSAACFAVPVMGLIAFGTANDVRASFVIAVVSACLFGVASLWHFGPESA